MNNIKVTKEGNLETTLRGKEVLSIPTLNKGVAFSAEERKSLGLDGLLPPTILSLDEQAKRAYEQFQAQPDRLRQNVYLNDLQNRNEVLFFKLLQNHLREMRRLFTHRLSVKRFKNTAMSTEDLKGFTFLSTM